MPEDMPSKLRAELTEIAEDTIERLIADFEAAGQVDDAGNEFWFARDLQQLLGYGKWEHFSSVVEKAKASCIQSGHPVEDHFPGVGKMVAIGSGATREIEDIALSRYASYLVAQNGDSRKQPVAFAQTYFAIQTRRQEVREQEDSDNFTPLPEDEKRLLLREEIKAHNKALASAAKDAGVVSPVEFAVFQTHGYKGLYGGLDVNGIRSQKGLKKTAKILDHMGSTELAANLFRATQTEEKLKRENVKGKSAANKTHHEVGRKVRQTIAEIGGTMPEDLPAAEDIAKIEKKRQKQIKGPNDE